MPFWLPSSSSASAPAAEEPPPAGRLMRHTGVKPAVLRASAEKDSERKGELARGAIVEVIEQVTLPDGTVRGHIPALGWVTLIKDDATER